MVDVLTYQATKVYTPQTSEYAALAKGVQTLGEGIASGVKTIAKAEEGKEKRELETAKVTAKMNAEIEKQNKALMKEKASAYDKVLDAQADNLAQRFQIDLARQTGFINAQYNDDPLNPEKEKQIRAVAQDLQAQYLEKIPQASRERFTEKSNSKTNEYILSDIKSSVKKQIEDGDKTAAENVRSATDNAMTYASEGNFTGVRDNFIESRGDLENYLSGVMNPENQAIAMRQFDQNYIASMIKGVAQNNPQLARELKDNPAAVSAILINADYITELALRNELNMGMEQIDGMEFPKNARYRKEKEQAKLLNSVGLVEIEYDEGGQTKTTLASPNANPQMTRYTAELLSGGAGKDLDMAIKQAELAQKAKLEQARYDGAVQSVFHANYQNLDRIKNSDLYKSGDKYTVEFADKYEKAINEKREILNDAVKMTPEELHKAYKDFTKSLEKIDGKSIDPVIDSYTQMSKIQAALSLVRDDQGMGEYVQKAFENAVTNQDFRSGLTQTIRNNWTPVGSYLFAGESARDSQTFANRHQERNTIKAENEAMAGFLALAGQGRLDEAKKYYTDKRNAFYDGIYSEFVDMNAILNAWKEGKQANVKIGNALYCAVERDGDGQILFEPLMTKVNYNG